MLTSSLCSAEPTVVLPRLRPLTPLGYLQCFLDPVLIDTFVTNTDLYAADRGATQWVPVTPEEMWRYLGYPNSSRHRRLS